MALPSDSMCSLGETTSNILSISPTLNNMSFIFTWNLKIHITMYFIPYWCGFLRNKFLSDVEQ